MSENSKTVIIAGKAPTPMLTEKSTSAHSRMVCSTSTAPIPTQVGINMLASSRTGKRTEEASIAMQTEHPREGSLRTVNFSMKQKLNNLKNLAAFTCQ